MPLNFILIDDVFVLIDDGTASAADYSSLGGRVRKQAAAYPDGLGALTIIPKEARPPTPEVRSAINELLGRLGPSLQCLCWLVEGGGFHSAMVQAVLTGLRMFGKYPYLTHVSTDLEEAVGWILPQLSGGGARLKSVKTTCRSIVEQRQGPPVRQL